MVALARYYVRTVIAKRTYVYGTFTVRRTYPYTYYEYGNVLLTGTVVVFTGTLTATRYVDILDAALVLFLDTVYPYILRFQQDNDPKHTSRYAKNYIEEKEINWFKTPTSSPDLNPIELIWHTLKDYLRKNYKPKNLSELKSGIKEFWATLTPSICKKYSTNHKQLNTRPRLTCERAARAREWSMVHLRVEYIGPSTRVLAQARTST